LTQSLDSFNSTIDPVLVGLTAISSSLVVNSNLPYPAWTYDELVFPTLDVNKLINLDDDQPISSNTTGLDRQYDTVKVSSVFKAAIPTLRASLNCKALPSSNLSISAFNELDVSSLEITANLGGNCGDTGNSDSPDFPFEVLFINLDGASTDSILGSSPSFGEGSYFGQTTGVASSEPGPTCPSVISCYGQYFGNNSKVYCFTCSPIINRLSVNTTFLLPDFTINATTVDEASTELFSSDFASSLDFQDVLFASSGTNNTANDVFDGFYSTLIYSLKTITPSDLNNESLSTILDASDHLYRLLMAQAINMSSRLLNQNANNTILGTIVDPSQLRLEQSFISTRILEALIALMFICAAITIVMMDTREVLPKNPCSIAGAASLLAGSEMLNPEIIPPGSEWFDDRTLIDQGVFRGLLFSLGWWGGKGREQRFGIDVGRAG
jgi:hypothetical protein